MSVFGFFRHIPVFLLVLLVLSSGCGKKTLPVAPQTVLPVPISDLRYSLDEQGLKLSWSRPGFSETGARLKKVEDFEVLKAAYPAADFCEGCPLSFNATIPVRSPAPQKFGHNDPAVTYHDQDLQPGYRYFYKVRSVAGWQVISQDSNVISLTWMVPVGPPTALAIDPGDKRLTISWQPPVAETGRMEPLAYSVLRSTDGEHFDMLLEKTAETRFTDLQVQNGLRYHYRIRAFRLSQGAALPGRESQPISGLARDMTPPVPPANLSRVKTAKGVKLFWNMTMAKDLAGYRIYRRPASAQDPVMVDTVPADTLTYIDEQLPNTESVWYYSVTAIDRSEPPNESLHSLEVRYEAVK